MMIRYIHIVLIIFALVASSCVREATPEEIATFKTKQIEKRIAKIKRDKRKDCIKAIQQDATTYIDSIILGEFQVDLLDSIEMIEKPFKPQRPQYIRDIDTSKVKPIF